MNTLLFGDRTNPADGLGRLGQCLADNVEGLTPASQVSDILGEDGTMLVHCRRDKMLLPALIEHCQRTGEPLLNLSTGETVELPEDLNFLYLDCPNISLEVLGFMQRVQQACAEMDEPFNLDIIEHHQPAKKDRSGTAQAMHDRAAALPHCRNQPGYYRKNIASVRNLAKTRAAGYDVTAEHEAGYAIHEAVIMDNEEEAARQFKPLEIYGRKTYAEGLQSVLQTLQTMEPITGRLHITDFARKQGLI